MVGDRGFPLHINSCAECLLWVTDKDSRNQHCNLGSYLTGSFNPKYYHKSPGLADSNHVDLNHDLNQLIFFLIKISDLN